MNKIVEKYIWANLDAAKQSEILQRPAVGVGPEIISDVQDIILNVRRRGDDALKELSLSIEKVNLTDFKVSQDEFNDAEKLLSGDQIKSLKTAIKNVCIYHEAQLTEDLKIETSPGVLCERITRPISSVGLYVPAGTAPLPSTAIMLSVPSNIAGSSTRVLCT
ncbi:MAG: histidinol dehydrogenase, partial [Pseudomonadota bacterium]|nr:histidinol dehydrogenase [Pseudomonadota bacterium]